MDLHASDLRRGDRTYRGYRIVSTFHDVRNGRPVVHVELDHPDSPATVVAVLDLDGDDLVRVVDRTPAL